MLVRVLDGVDAFLDQLGLGRLPPARARDRLPSPEDGLHEPRLAERARRGLSGGARAVDLDLRRVPRGRRDQRDHPGARRRRRPDRPRAPRDPGEHVHDGRLEHARPELLRHVRGERAPRLGAHDGRAARASTSSRASRASTSRGSSRGRCSSSSSSPASSSRSASSAFWIAGHVADFRERVAQAFRVISPPTRYLGRVAIWQAADWGLRLLTIWFLLDAFHIPQSLENAALVQVSSSVATLFPITPARRRHGAGVPALRAERRRVRRPCSSRSASARSSR